MATFSYTKPTVGGSEDTWGDTLNANWDAIGTFLGSLDSTELAVLDGITASTAELNLLDGVTASTAELNLLDGVTATTAEINYLDGVTSAIQGQIDNIPAPPELTQVQVEDDTSAVFGQVSGQRLAQAVAAFQTDNGEIVASSGLTSTSGYVKFANGIIFQWVYAVGSGTKVCTYPITFPNRVWHVSMSTVANTQNYQSPAHRSNWVSSLSNITVYNDGAAVEIFAVGY